MFLFPLQYVPNCILFTAQFQRIVPLLYIYTAPWFLRLVSPNFWLVWTTMTCFPYTYFSNIPAADSRHLGPGFTSAFGTAAGKRTVFLSYRWVCLPWMLQFRFMLLHYRYLRWFACALGFIPGRAEVTGSCATNFLTSAVSLIASTAHSPFVENESTLLLKKIFLLKETNKKILQ